MATTMTGRSIAAMPPGHVGRQVKRVQPRPVVGRMAAVAPAELYGVVVTHDDGSLDRIDLSFASRADAERHARDVGLDASAVAPVRMTATAHPH